MLMLRLARTGKKKQARFRLIVSDKTKDTFGTNLEILGNFDPHQDPPRPQFNADRVKFWLSRGAQPSLRVHNLLVDLKLITGEKVKVWKAKRKEATPEPTSVKTAPPTSKENIVEQPAPEPKTEVVEEKKPVENQAKT